MDNFEIPENPEYIEDIRKFKETDPGHADLFNETVQSLVNNEAYLKKVTEEHAGAENPHGITPQNIGSPSNEYMEEHFVPDYASSSLFYTGSEGVGWYRIAKAKYPYYNSCTITLKRSYNSPGPEYQKIQLMDAYDKHKFVSIAAYSHSHAWTKIRETWDGEKSEAYIEIYLNHVNYVNGAYKSNNWRISIEDALNAVADGAWKAITPEKVEETVDGIEILASMDLPANFDISYLVNKNGDSVNGLLKFIQNGMLRFISPDVAEDARGIEFYNKNGTERWGGIGVHALNGAPDRIYIGAGTNSPWNPANGLSIMEDSMKWKNSDVVTRDSEADKNTASGSCSAVIGGGYNTASGADSTILGGSYNTASGTGSAVLGGDSNTSSGVYSVVLGGLGNTASGHYSATLGGREAKATNFGSIAAGKYNKGMHNFGGATSQNGDVFVIGNGTGSTELSNALRVTYQGDVLGTKAFQSSGADYAEFVKPWWDGNPESEDRAGYFVTVKDGLLYKANEGDYILGITSGNPSVVGNADEDYYWKYERDAFNRIVMEDVPEEIQAVDKDGNPMFDEETHEPIMVETGNIIKNARMKLSESYDPSLQEGYIERKDRKEWDYVGMVGVIPVRDDGTCLPDHFCKCGQGGIATLAEERGIDTFYVIERISDNIVSVELR